MGGLAGYNRTDMSFNPIVRLLLQYMFDNVEGQPERPFDEEPYASQPNLAFPAGHIWYSPTYRTARLTVEEYEGDPTPGPLILNVARNPGLGLVVGSTSVTIAHNMKCFPVVQFMDNNTRELLVPDNIIWNDLDTLTVEFTGTWDALAMMVG